MQFGEMFSVLECLKRLGRFCGYLRAKANFQDFQNAFPLGFEASFLQAFEASFLASLLQDFLVKLGFFHLCSIRLTNSGPCETPTTGGSEWLTDVIGQAVLGR